eukprot:TRINITY_DN5706_c0_g1_i7.p1 TRINITY_DN5706_c0_g1~~TRINITY_DN5706_c0_g1_i7.p1  ORF type:complete len:356 (+),score=84.31 TRINITY_DN5706_c0_g1_i7:228-1295(+)
MATKLVTLACCAALAAAGIDFRAEPGVEQQFQQFKQEFQKQYTDEREEERRFQCFTRTLLANQRRNEQALYAAQRTGEDPSQVARFGVTKFADLCPFEFREKHLSGLMVPAPPKATRAGGAQEQEQEQEPLFSDEEVRAAQQEAFDWRAKGAVTPVGDEGQCGSTWAWAAVDTMEAQWFLKGNKLVPLSVQQVNSCDPQSQGCNGGLMDYAYQWGLTNKGIDSAADYPYTSGTGNSGTCNKAKLGKRVAHFSNYTDLPADEGQLLAWVAKRGPIAVSVNAVSWKSYTGGVLSNCDPNNVDHAVALVGYTPQSGNTPAYWIVKNMWGVKWGEAGYIRLEYGKNTCGLTSDAGTILA